MRAMVGRGNGAYKVVVPNEATGADDNFSDGCNNGPLRVAYELPSLLRKDHAADRKMGAKLKSATLDNGQSITPSGLQQSSNTTDEEHGGDKAAFFNQVFNSKAGDNKRNS